MHLNEDDIRFGFNMAVDMNQSNYVLSDSDDGDDELNITNNYDISPYSLNEDGMHFADIIIRVPNSNRILVNKALADPYFAKINSFDEF